MAQEMSGAWDAPVDSNFLPRLRAAAIRAELSDEMSELFRAIFDDYHAEADVAYELGRFAWDQDLYEKATDLFRLSLTAKTSSIALEALLQARVWLEQGILGCEDLVRFGNVGDDLYTHYASPLAELALYEDPSNSLARYILSSSSNLSESQRIAILMSDGVNGDEAAIGELERMVAGGSFGAPLALGNLLSSRHRYARAEAAYRIGIQRGDGHSAYNLAIDLANTGRASESEELYKVAAKLGDSAARRRLDEYE